jgi:hypothetical protein
VVLSLSQGRCSRARAGDAATVERAGFVDLGAIKGNVGDQNYILPSDLDMAKHRAVLIWCKRFSVNFGAAALKPAQVSGLEQVTGLSREA